MIEAALWGLLGASSLVLGAILAFQLDVSARVRGLILAFGAGTLIGAVAYELIEEAAGIAMRGAVVGLGLAVGAVTFFLGSVAIDRMGAANPSEPADDAGSGSGRLESRRDPRVDGEAVVLGAVLDGIPESVVLGVSLIGGGSFSLPMLLAVFISNVPEALAASTDLARGGLSRARILVLWTVVALASAAAAALGYGLLDQAPGQWVASVQMFAAGAIIAMLAESMVPEAYEKAGRAVGLATAVGFAAAAVLSAAS